MRISDWSSDVCSSDLAGFNVGFSLIAVDASSSYGRIFLVGLLNSLLVAAVGIVAATLLGFVIGLARVSPNVPARLLSKGYVELVRNLPLLLHLLLWQGVILRSLPTVREALDLRLEEHTSGLQSLMR